MGVMRAPKVTAERATEEELPLETDWVVNGMPQPKTNGPESAQEIHGADGRYLEDGANIKFAHDYVLSELENRGEAFLDQFTTMSGNEEDVKQFDLAYNPQKTGRTILHRIINSVSEERLGPDIATRFTKQIVQEEPDLREKRSVLDNDLNALELAVSSQNCLGIIRAICEHGMLEEIEDANDKKGIDLKEVELQSASIQGQKLIPSGSTDRQINTLALGAISQGKILPATNNESESRATIKKDGKIFSVYIKWRDLTQEGADTILHKAIQKKRNDYARYLLELMRDMKEHELILMHKGQSGLIPLHHAVNYIHCNSERVGLVDKMIHLCPKALAMDSAALLPNSQSIAQDQAARGVQKN